MSYFEISEFESSTVQDAVKMLLLFPLRNGRIALGILGLITFVHSMVVNGPTAWPYIVAYGILLYGSCKKSQTAVLLYLIFDQLTIISMFTIVIRQCFFIAESHGNTPIGEIRIFVVLTIQLVANAYFWVCVFSFYKQLLTK